MAIADLEPHGICLASSPDIVGMLVFSDFCIALAYFIIPAILFAAVRRTPAPTLFTLFGIFIFGCGLSHVMDVVTMFFGDGWYWRQAAVLVITACASLTTAAVLVDAFLHPENWLARGPL